MAEKKKYDSDIVGWYTKGGKRIPIRKGEPRPKTAKQVASENAKKTYAPKESRKGGDPAYRGKKKPAKSGAGYKQGDSVNLHETFLDKRGYMVDSQKAKVTNIRDDEMELSYKNSEGKDEKKYVGIKWFENHMGKFQKK